MACDRRIHAGDPYRGMVPQPLPCPYGCERDEKGVAATRGHSRPERGINVGVNGKWELVFSAVIIAGLWAHEGKGSDVDKVQGTYAIEDKSGRRLGSGMLLFRTAQATAIHLVWETFEPVHVFVEGGKTTAGHTVADSWTCDGDQDTIVFRKDR
jgi:hypothetical protein